MADKIPRLVVIKLANDSQKCIHYDNNGSVVCSEESVLSSFAKIEIEPSKSDDKFVHLRFYHNNKYLMADPHNSDILLSTSNKPDEDASKASCTLFQPISHDQHIVLKHVHTARYVVTNDTRVILDNESTVLSFVNWEALVIMPKHVTFKGDNGRYLQGQRDGYLQFSSNDGNAMEAAYDIHPMPNGYVRINSIYFGKFWRFCHDGCWIMADSDDDVHYINSWFWPVKIDDKTIALRNESTNNFCKRFTAQGNTDCLYSLSSGIPREARLEVEELVLARKIYNVRYRWEDARLFNERVYVAGTTTVINRSDMEDSFAVKISHVETRSHTFTKSGSLSLAVKTTIEANLLSFTGAKIEVSGQFTGSFTSGETTTTTITVEATGTVKVGKKSRATVGYVGTQGTFTIPYSYTQEDQNSSDGQFVFDEYVDGMYTGVNGYNFQFDILESVPL